MTDLADNSGTSLIHRPGGGAPRYGVVLRLHVSDRFYGTEIQVAAALRPGGKPAAGHRAHYYAGSAKTNRVCPTFLCPVGTRMRSWPTWLLDPRVPPGEITAMYCRPSTA